MEACRAINGCRMKVCRCASAVLSWLFLPCCALAQEQWFVRSSGTTKLISSVAFGNGVFLATDGRPLLSEDNGVTWRRPIWEGDDQIYAIFFGGNQFVALGDRCLFRSVDGKSAKRITHSGQMFGPSSGGSSAAYIAGRWVFTGYHLGEPPNVTTPVFTSGSDGVVAPLTEFPSGYADWVINGGQILMAGSGTALFTSPDGLGWSLVSRSGFYSPPLFRNGVFFAPDYGRASNDNGRTWAEVKTENPPQNFEVSAEGSGIFAVWNSWSGLLSSTDGLKWVAREPGTTDTLYSIAFGNNTFVAVGDSGRITTSSTGMAPASPVAPQLQISTVVRLTWQSEKGRYYQRESSLEVSSRWEPFGEPIPGNGGMMESFSEITSSRKFFRMVVK